MDKPTMKNPATEKVTDISGAAKPEPNIGKLLIEAGKLKPEDSERIHKLQEDENLRFGEAAVKLGLLTEADIQQALASQYNYAYLRPGEQNFSPELAAAYKPFTPQVESFRALRTQLKLRWFNPSRKRLAVIGASVGAGCTYHVANLAVVFGQLGERTLLIDGNLRDPRVHQVFGLGNRQGLAEVLGGRVDHVPIVPLPKLGNLSVLPAGATPPNPAELLSRSALQTLLTQLEQYFDVILLDTPPARPFTDALTIAAHCGAALLVARLNHTRLDDLAAIKDSLAVTSAEIAGVTLNKY
jgi:chain length determinant protein tyrosine kinase EpsG